MSETVDWIKSWNDIGDTLAAAILFYALIVIAVRIFGKRSTAQMNNFDWIINITVGSLAASGILLDSVPAVRAMVAIAAIMFLQFALTWLVLRYKSVSALVKASPTLLTDKGRLLHDALLRTRITENEIYSALREQGMCDLSQANWVILETDGRLTVIPRSDVSLEDASAMQNVRSGSAQQNARLSSS